jgi:GT2 family glycosyltransferase
VAENKIYAVIVSFNGETLIRQCLNSLRKSSVPVSIVVVDNASDDDTVKIIETDFPEVVLFKSAKNNGFGHANNIGIKYAYDNGASNILLLNQDAWTNTDTIEKMISAGKENPEYLVLSPVHLNKDGSGFDSGFMQYALPPFCENFFYDMYSSSHKRLYSTTFVNAAAWLMSRETISSIGFFDPLFFHYGEDRDYCNRVLFHKKMIGIVSDSVIYHSRETTSGRKKNSLQELKISINRNYFLRLIELKKADQPFSTLCIHYAADLFLSSLKNCLRLRLTKSLTDFLTMFRLLGDIPAIIRHRKECSKTGESYVWSIGQAD